MVDFLIVITELFCYLLRLRHYKRKSVEVGVFRRGWVIFSANFREKGRRLPTTVGVRVTAISCGIKISTQSTRVTDRQMDRITTPKTALAQVRCAVKTLLHEILHGHQLDEHTEQIT